MSRTIVRRIPLASLLVVGTLVVAGALGGWATATSDEATVPETFQLATRQAGDKGTWHLSIVSGGHEEVLGSVHTAGGPGGGSPMGDEASASMGPSTHDSTVAFEWLPEEAWPDGAGEWHAVHALLAVDLDAGLTTNVNGRETQTPYWDLLRFATSTGALVGRTGLAGGGASSSSGLLGGEEVITVVTATSWDTVAYHGDVACRLGDALRAGVRLADPVTVEGCALEPVTFEATGVEEVNGVQAVRFHGKLASESLTFWFNPGIPEPVRVVREGGSEDGPSYRVQRDLHGFVPGTDPWDTGIALPPPTSVPAIETAPRQPWGPDDSGLDHPFRLSEAWRRAAEDPTFADFRDFLAANPDAAAVRAEFVEETDGLTTVRTWGLLVLADGGAFWLDATQTESAHLASLVGSPSSAVATYRFSGSAAAVAGYPMPDELPGTLPTAASTLAYFEALYGEGANAYGLDGPSTGPGSLAVTAGITRRDQPMGQPGQPQPDPTFTSNLLLFTAEGSPLELREVDEEYTRRAGLLSPPGAVSGGSSVEEAPTAQVMLRGALTPWALPVSTATGVTVTALLVGTVALLWPVLKGLPLFGLFSRVQTDRLLDHPVRSRIAMAIEARPGIHYQALLREAGTGKGALEHHLRKLETAGLVTAVRSGRYTCYFPQGTSARVRGMAPALKSDGAKRILEAVQANPGISGQALVAATGLSPSTVSAHVARMTEAGLLQGVRSGRSLHVHATASARDAQQLA